MIPVPIFAQHLLPLFIKFKLIKHFINLFSPDKNPLCDGIL